MQLQLVVQQSYELEDVASATSALAATMPSVTPFIEPFWLIPWLKQNQDKHPIWLQCVYGDTLVASIFVVMKEPEGLPSPFTSGWFNKTGDNQRDQIWIEFNDLLSHPQWHDQSVSLILDWCKTVARDWRFEITASPAPWLTHPDFYTESTSIPGYAVALEKEFANKEAYLAHCSSNTRSRIRRAIKYIEANYGAVTVRSFGNRPPEAVWDEIAQFHLERWQDTEQGSGFDNPDFVAFHKALMMHTSSDTSPRCDILGFYAGEQCIGYTYNLLSNGNVFFYLSGINYLEASNRFQPGLVLHTYAVSYYTEQGYTRYDFMGGDSQYKRSLSNFQYELFMVRLIRKDWLTAIFQTLKMLKTKIFKRNSS